LVNMADKNVSIQQNRIVILSSLSSFFDSMMIAISLSFSDARACLSISVICYGVGYNNGELGDYSLSTTKDSMYRSNRGESNRSKDV